MCNVHFQIRDDTTVLELLKDENRFPRAIISFSAITGIGHILSRKKEKKRKVVLKEKYYQSRTGCAYMFYFAF